LLEALTAKLATSGADLQAWAVLPNHYHLLLQVDEPAHIGASLQYVHGIAARQWNQEDKSEGRKVWYRYTDRAMRSERHFYVTLNYVHYNAVKHGWASSPHSWVESSVAWYRDHFGIEWLRDLWTRYPVRDYGRGWDEK
jgi:putative transposase